MDRKAPRPVKNQPANQKMQMIVDVISCFNILECMFECYACLHMFAQQDYSDYSYSRTPSPRPKRRLDLDGFGGMARMTCMTT